MRTLKTFTQMTVALACAGGLSAAAFAETAGQPFSLPEPDGSYTARIIVEKGNALPPYWEGDHFLIRDGGVQAIEFRVPEDLQGDYGSKVIQLQDLADPMGGPFHGADIAEFNIDRTFGLLYAESRYPFLLTDSIVKSLNIVVTAVEDIEIDGKAAKTYSITSSGLPDYVEDRIEGSVTIGSKSEVLAVDLAGRFEPEGQEDYRNWSLSYRVEEIKFRPIDPKLLTLPELEEGVDWIAPG